MTTEIEDIEAQNKEIRAWLVGGKTLTSLQAATKLKNKCMRLAARIWDIRNGVGIKKLAIKKNMITVGNKRVAEYYYPRAK